MTTRIAMALAIAVLVALIIFAGPAACSKFRSMAEQARLGHAQGEAQANSSADAVNTVARAGEASAASEDMTRTNEREIRNAQGADDRVQTGVNDAGIRALCLRASYRDSERCRLLRPNPDRVEQRR